MMIAVICVKIRLLAFCGAAILLLTGCRQTIRGARDEIRQYDWVGKFDNGNTAELSFNDSDAAFLVESKDFSLDIIGLCSLTDDSLVIIDNRDDVSYEFDYTLHGDCVELCYQGDVVTLEKKVEK